MDRIMASKPPVDPDPPSPPLPAAPISAPPYPSGPYTAPPSYPVVPYATTAADRAADVSAPLPASYLAANVVYKLPARTVETAGLYLANSNAPEAAAIVVRVADDGLVSLRLFVDGVTEHHIASVRYGWTWGTWHFPIDSAKIEAAALSESEIATMRADFVDDGPSGEYLVALCDRAAAGEAPAVDTLKTYRASGWRERNPRDHRRGRYDARHDSRYDGTRDAVARADARDDAAVARGDAGTRADAAIARESREAAASRESSAARSDAAAARSRDRSER